MFFFSVLEDRLHQSQRDQGTSFWTNKQNKQNFNVGKRMHLFNYYQCELYLQDVTIMFKMSWSLLLSFRWNDFVELQMIDVPLSVYHSKLLMMALAIIFYLLFFTFDNFSRNIIPLSLVLEESIKIQNWYQCPKMRNHVW